MMKNDKLKNSNEFSENKIKPLIAYFSFTNKYLLKKKSTIIFPIFSFLILLLVSLFPMFVEADAEMFNLFYSLTVSTSIVLTGLFATVKSLNLFKDISSEGLEILIVSKPIERWQIILVRFVYFIVIGLLYCLINYISLYIALSCLSSEIPTDFSIFNNLNIFFFSMLLIYILFGTISILLSLKFSTKLVTTFSSGIIGAGIILSNILPTIIPIVEKGFEYHLMESSSKKNENYIQYSYFLTENNEIIIYNSQGKVWDPQIDSSKELQIRKALEEKQDLSWIVNMNNLINPIAGINKFSSIPPSFYTRSILSGENVPNLFDYHASFEEKTIINNNDGDYNYFFNIDKIKNKTFQFHVQAPNDPSLLIDINLRLINNEVPPSEDSWLKIDKQELLNKFNDILKNIAKNKPTSNEVLKTEIVNSLNELTDFDKKIKDGLNGRYFTEKFEDADNIDINDLADKTKILLFYLYLIDKLNNNFNSYTSETSEDEIKYIKELLLFSENISTFLGIDYKVEKESLINSSSVDQKFLVFVQHGEKLSSTVIGLSWSFIIFIVLTSTILIYYRKDFS